MAKFTRKQIQAEPNLGKGALAAIDAWLAGHGQGAARRNPDPPKPAKRRTERGESDAAARSLNARNAPRRGRALFQRVGGRTKRDRPTSPRPWPQWKDARRMAKRKNAISGQFTVRLVEMLGVSPAFRILSPSALRALSRIEIEFAHHNGCDNGKLPVTFNDFERYAAFVATASDRRSMSWKRSGFATTHATRKKGDQG